VEIVDLEDRYEPLFCKCLEDWSAEMEEAGDSKKLWLDKKKQEGLRVRLARDGNGDIVGMIQYAPVEKSPILGENLYYVYCIWVHGHKKGVGNRQGKGIGTMLLDAAESDARSLGAAGMAAWGIVLPFFMRSKWFRKHGYKKADRDGMIELVWKPFSELAIPPKLYKVRKKPGKKPGVVSVTCFRNGWCPAQNLTVERVRRAVSEYPGRIEFREIDTEDRERLEEWGISDGVYVDGKELHNGPPPSYARLKRKIGDRVRKL
jgi:GNAT superfamily N-acetyltransferase